MRNLPLLRLLSAIEYWPVGLNGAFLIAMPAKHAGATSWLGKKISAADNRNFVASDPTFSGHESTVSSKLLRAKEVLASERI
jgi:hypothetical protein